ncbi:hypothetical protein [Pseudomonas sp. LS-2]|uniref:hypothetical protein n=1 Tax=Pseudomonas sp. LS-2 TaxID=2315859 RepID=UPI001059070C|nr:hypothetical protein [Pseudomonas sp. LS-2]
MPNSYAVQNFIRSLAERGVEIPAVVSAWISSLVDQPGERACSVPVTVTTLDELGNPFGNYSTSVTQAGISEIISIATAAAVFHGSGQPLGHVLNDLLESLVSYGIVNDSDDFDYSKAMVEITFDVDTSMGLQDPKLGSAVHSKFGQTLLVDRSRLSEAKVTGYHHTYPACIKYGVPAQATTAGVLHLLSSLGFSGERVPMSFADSRDDSGDQITITALLPVDAVIADDLTHVRKKVLVDFNQALESFDEARQIEIVNQYVRANSSRPKIKRSGKRNYLAGSITRQGLAGHFMKAGKKMAIELKTYAGKCQQHLEPLPSQHSNVQLCEALVARLIDYPEMGILICHPNDSRKAVFYVVWSSGKPRLHSVELTENGRIRLPEAREVSAQVVGFNEGLVYQVNHPVYIDLAYENFGDYQDLFTLCSDEDTEIRRVFESACGRFQVSPSEHLFEARDADSDYLWFKDADKGTLIANTRTQQIKLVDKHTGQILAVSDVTSIPSYDDELAADEEAGRVL